MNELDTILLHQYFNGLLSPEDAQKVDARAATDPDFGAEFLLRKGMEAFPRTENERTEMLSLLKNIGKDYFRDETAKISPMRVVRNNARRWIALAASVVLIAAAIWFITKPGTPDYKQYAQHAPLSLTVMGDNAASKTEAENAFNQKKYDRALTALEQVVQAEPDNIKARFYQGICLLELHRAGESRVIFESLVAGNSALREDARWYMALSYLKEQNKTACRDALLKIDSGSIHYEMAQQILKGL